VKWILLFAFFLSWVQVHSQTFMVKERIAVATTKTVSLIFPAHVQSIDRGSDHFIVQKAAANIVKVKAVKDSFPETNLTIITTDGKLYSLILEFSTSPQRLIWHFGDSLSVKTEHPFKAMIDQVKKTKSGIAGLKYSSGQVSLQWLGWFIQEDKLFCKIKLTNRSSIGFDIDQFQFYIRDNQISKRTATQELLQQPHFISGDTGTIKARGARVHVIVLDKFTIPDEKHFAIEVLERNGGRHLYLKIHNRQLMSAKIL